MSRVFRHRIRVRYVETDAQQVVHHSAYVAWLEEARIEALRQVGFSYRTLEAEGLFMPVTELSLRYRRPAHFDDEVELQTTISAPSRCTVAFTTELQRGQEALASATVTVAVVDGSARLRRLPEDLAAALDLGS